MYSITLSSLSKPELWLSFFVSSQVANVIWLYTLFWAVLGFTYVKFYFILLRFLSFRYTPPLKLINVVMYFNYGVLSTAIITPYDEIKNI